jgi:general secretion pathway protein E
VNQIGVNNAINRTFSNTMRHILRHDPDVILVGEIRDRETAQMAFEAALTGHMVLSTLHTNDVPSTFTRLLDIGVEPFLINATIECVTAQRLFRKVCPVCRNEPELRHDCEHCLGIGYRDRTAIMEHAIPTHELKRAVRDQADDLAIREILEAGGYRSMRRIAMDLADAGVTDLAEVIRVLGPEDHR